MKNKIVKDTEIEIVSCARKWLIERANMEELWENMEKFATKDERLPYWADLWPSSIFLARWLEANKNLIQGRFCLDIGCGLGFISLIGSYLGAQVLAFDYEPSALHFARKNALKNLVSPLFVAMDWRKPAILPGVADFAFAGDIMYEKRFANPLADFLFYALKEGGKAFIAEPSRAVYKDFIAAAELRGMSINCIMQGIALDLTPEKTPVSVKIWQIDR